MDQRRVFFVGATMADRKSLGILGFVLAGMTFAVMLAATIVVKDHIDGRRSLDSVSPVVASLPVALVR